MTVESDFGELGPVEVSDLPCVPCDTLHTRVVKGDENAVGGAVNVGLEVSIPQFDRVLE
jgi:hypothetical protein